jgi:NAD-dependent dihydropyrimidine dehydrogenase PreA subunit
VNPAVKSPGPPTGELRVVLFEGEGAERLGDERRLGLLKSLLEAGHPVTRTSRTDAPGEALVALAMGSAPAAFEHRIDLRDTQLDGAPATVNARREAQGIAAPGAWTPWFPVIDFQRCTNCMQCLSFCLFDVYGVDAEGQIEVRNESKCKTNCPACSRVCPDIAILFPKYAKGPINGDVVRDGDVEKESMKVDISALLGGDIYAALRDRSQAAKKRFSTERDESRALLERKRCLKELQEGLDIPDEVLMSLPSTGEIEQRARRAREKMERRRARSQTVKDESERRVPGEEEWGI